MAQLKDTTVNGSLRVQSSDKTYMHDVATELEKFVTNEYVLEQFKQHLTWTKLGACTGGTANKSLPDNYTWNSYKELMLTVGVWEGGNVNAISRILASTIIPVDSSTTSVYGIDASGRYQVVYDSTTFHGGFNITSENTYQLICPNSTAYISLWGR